LSDNNFPDPEKDHIVAEGVYYDKAKVDAWREKLRKRLEEELEDGDKVTMENCLIELLEMLKC